MTRDDVVEMMIGHLRADTGETLKGVTDTNGAHNRFSYLRGIFKKHLLE